MGIHIRLLKITSGRLKSQFTCISGIFKLKQGNKELLTRSCRGSSTLPSLSFCLAPGIRNLHSCWAVGKILPVPWVSPACSERRVMHDGKGKASNLQELLPSAQQSSCSPSDGTPLGPLWAPWGIVALGHPTFTQSKPRSRVDELYLEEGFLGLIVFP